jgi:hypothetical protein
MKKNYDNDGEKIAKSKGECSNIFEIEAQERVF